MFFRALTVNPKTDRLQAFLRPANLSAADFALVVGTGPEFESLRSAYRQHERGAVAAAGSAGTAVDWPALEAEKAGIGLKVKSLLQSRLSPKGMAGLDALIQSEKRKMTIFPLPDMSGANDRALVPFFRLPDGFVGRFVRPKPPHGHRLRDRCP